MQTAFNAILKKQIYRAKSTGIEPVDFTHMIKLFQNKALQLIVAE